MEDGAPLIVPSPGVDGLHKVAKAVKNSKNELGKYCVMSTNTPVIFAFFILISFIILSFEFK